jgi:hypothetical protein
MPQELLQSERDGAIAQLDEISDQLAAAATWLSQKGLDQAAILLESSWRDVQAASHVLERRNRRQPPGWLGRQPYELYGPQRRPAEHTEPDGRSGWTDRR